MKNLKVLIETRNQKQTNEICLIANTNGLKVNFLQSRYRKGEKAHFYGDEKNLVDTLRSEIRSSKTLTASDKNVLLAELKFN